MTRPAWERVEELYHAALAHEAAEREAFLASACADEALRSEVLSLLAHEASADRLLEQPALAAGTEKLALLTGTRLGPYEVLGLVGAGGMGEVYRARDSRLGREVAIKTLPASLADDPERLRRFEREARAVASLNHPHVLTVHDVGTHEGVPYVVTVRRRGRSYRRALRRRAGRLLRPRTGTRRLAAGAAARRATGASARSAEGTLSSSPSRSRK
jgi:eukaryotic-like serine/threonine-protein kinase